MPVTEFLKPRDVAELLSVNIDKVGDWIASGDLAAVNVAKASGGIRPRWRISRAALDSFLASRQTQPSVPTPRKKREQSEASYY